MPNPFDPRYQFCMQIEKSVCVCRSENECRREHGCTNSNCPLEDAFGLEAFDSRMRAFATAFDLWPLKEGMPSRS